MIPIAVRANTFRKKVGGGVNAVQAESLQSGATVVVVVGGGGVLFDEVYEAKRGSTWSTQHHPRGVCVSGGGINVTC